MGAFFMAWYTNNFASLPTGIKKNVNQEWPDFNQSFLLSVYYVIYIVCLNIMAEKHDQISYLNFFTKRERNDSEAGNDKTESGNEIPLPEADASEAGNHEK